MASGGAGGAVEGQNESRAVAGNAFELHVAAHVLHQFFNNAQAESGRRFATGGTGAQPAVTAENLLLVVLSETGTLIDHATFSASVGRQSDQQAHGFARR